MRDDPWKPRAPRATGFGVTRYDWKPGKRGAVLEPEGSSSELQNVVLLRGGVLEELWRAKRLKGQALADAEAKFGKGKP